MNFLTLQDILRFGVMVLTAIHVLALVTEGARTNLDYPNIRDYDVAPKPRSKPREIRGFKPHSMSTAIGFGKRQSNSYEPPKLNLQETMSFPLSDIPQRFSAEWFVRFLKINSELARKVERNSLSNGENVGASVLQRYKKNKSDDAYYYDE